MSLIGATLGQYQLVEAIGRGGMATVYRAFQPALNRHVAVKVLSPQHAPLSDFAERFEREAKAVAVLNHPNILPIIDFGQQAEYTYIVMKYVAGGTLADRLKQPIDLLTTARLIKQIAAALDHAHSRSVVHRDVKPSNVLLDVNEWVQLTDFGLAKLMGGDQHLTTSGLSLGTPAYISPEQGEGTMLDHHSDIYSLGVMLFEMTTGRLPFAAETPMGVVIKHIYDQPPAPRSIKPDLPESVEAIILRALAKPIAQRYDTAGELAHALETAVLQLAAHDIVTTHLEDPNATPRFGSAPPRVTPVTPLSRKQLMEETAPHVPGFIGRDTELALYRARLERDHFVIITGMAGMGKTTLGAKLARTVASSPTNIFWFTFDQVERSTADALYWALASFLDSRGEPNLWTYLQGEIGTQQPLERMAKLNLLMTSLASHEHVLCFDDFQIAAQLPDIAYIFKTIRQRFIDLHQDLPARIILMGREVTPDLEHLVSHTLGGLSENDTARFIAERGLRLPPELVHQLWTRTEGNPKLLELSTSALSGRHDLTQENFVVSLARKGDIRDYVLNNIYNALTSEEQTVMGALSVFAGAIEREGAEEVLSAEGVTQVAHRLDALVNKHIITEVDDEHLHVHSLVRDYCYHVFSRKDRERFHQRAADYFEERRNWVSAAHHHFERKLYARALDLLVDHAPAIINGGQVSALAEQLSRFSPRELETSRVLKLNLALGDAQRIRGEYPAALAAFAAARTSAHTDELRADVLHRISSTQLRVGDYDQAQIAAQESLAAAEKAGRRVAWATAQHDLGWVYYRLNDLERAQTCFSDSRAAALAEDAGLLAAEAELGLGLIAWKQARLTDAETYFQHSRQVFHDADESRREAYALINLGMIWHAPATASRAEEHYRAALTVQRHVGDINGLCFTLNNLGHISLWANNFPVAADSYRQLAELAAVTGGRRWACIAAVGLADAALAMNEIAAAHDHAARARTLADELATPLELGLSWRVWGEVLLRSSFYAEAQAAFEASLPALTTANETAEVERAQQGLAAAQRGARSRG